MIAEVTQRRCGAARRPMFGPEGACSYDKNEQIGAKTHAWVCKNCVYAAGSTQLTVQLHGPTIMRCGNCGQERGIGRNNNAIEHMLCNKIIPHATGALDFAHCATINLVDAKICIQCRSPFPTTTEHSAWGAEVTLVSKTPVATRWWCGVCGRDLPSSYIECQYETCKRRREADGLPIAFFPFAPPKVDPETTNLDLADSAKLATLLMMETSGATDVEGSTTSPDTEDVSSADNANSATSPETGDVNPMSLHDNTDEVESQVHPQPIPDNVSLRVPSA